MRLYGSTMHIYAFPEVSGRVATPLRPASTSHRLVTGQQRAVYWPKQTVHTSPTVCRAAGGFGASTSTAPPDTGPGTQRRAPFADRQEFARRGEELSKLVQEVAQIALSTGPIGAVRVFQAANAVLSVGRDYVVSTQQGAPETTPVVLRKLFEQLGATYIKLGQFIASSPTLFPEEYVLEFQNCLDSTPAVPWETIRKTIQEELQAPMDDVFSYIHPVPLASASVAQVHEAVLRGSNKEVVLKVLKPGTKDVLTTDLNFLYITTKVLEFINPDLARTSLVGIVGDIRASMLEEVDFVKEAAHIQEFQNYLDNAGLTGVATAPYVYKAFSSQRLLTMDKLNGVPLTNLAAIRSITYADPETVLINALNTWFGSVLGCETFHADVHAGNLLVLPDGRVGFIDFGIVGKISPATWGAMQALMLATSMDDYDTMARALLTMGATSEDVDVQAFSRDLERLFEQIQAVDTDLIVSGGGQGVAASMAVDNDQINRLLLQIVSVSEVHGIRFPREFGMLIKQLLYFDRYTRILAPQLRIMDDERLTMRNRPSY